MGLDFSHGDASWGYGGFMRFRSRLAACVGILDFDKITETTDPRFEKIKDDPIVHLLAHSDCDGSIEAKHCKKVAARLRELVEPWPDDYDRRTALELADGLDAAGKAGKPLRFT